MLPGFLRAFACLGKARSDNWTTAGSFDIISPMWGRIILFFSAAATPMASASPWAQDDGALYSRFAVSSETVDGLGAWRSDAYAEYGVTPKWTLTLKSEIVRFDNASDFDNESSRITARRELFRLKNGLVGALEGGLIDGGALGNQNTCETIGAEMRGGIGWSGAWRKTETFTFAELAGRFHENCQRERLEVGFGQKATRNIWVINQFWLERGSNKTSSDKVQTEVLWRAGRMDWSLGYRQEVGGTFEEEAIYAAVVRRF